MTNGPRQWIGDPERWLQMLTLVGGLAAFGIGLREYRQEQRWKRLEYFTQLLQSMEGDAQVRTGLTLLEYNQPRICDHDETPDTPHCFAATDSLVVGALDASMANRVLTPEEHEVISALDRLLTALDRIDYLQSEGFVAEEVRHPTVAYWISLIGDRNNLAKPPRVRAKLCEYVRYFEYAGALRLATRYTAPEDRVAACFPPSNRGS
jgi:hypothetical protein